MRFFLLHYAIIVDYRVMSAAVVVYVLISRLSLAICANLCRIRLALPVSELLVFAEKAALEVVANLSAASLSAC